MNRLLWDMTREMSAPPERWALMPGKPDFIFMHEGVVVFVDGCFFHRCPRHSSTPTTNVDFWTKKFMANVSRDKQVTKMLRSEGWIVMRFWECDIKADPDDVLFKIETELDRRRAELRSNHV